jgi:hypothetical protein
MAAKRKVEGVPLLKSVVSSLQELSEKFDVAPPLAIR